MGTTKKANIVEILQMTLTILGIFATVLGLLEGLGFHLTLRDGRLGLAGPSGMSRDMKRAVA